MNKLLRIGVVGGVIFAVLLFVPFLIPMTTYLRQAEQLLSNKLGVPVSIGSANLALLPSPRVNISEIVIGKDKEISVGAVSVVPALGSLFADTKVISSIKVKKPLIKKAALDILAAIPQASDKEPPTTSVTVQKIVIDGAKVEWPEISLPEFNAEIALTPANKPQSAKIESIDGKLKINLTPKDDLQLIEVSANKWTLPAGPPLLVDQLQMDMVLHEHKLEVSRMEALLYHGKLVGSTTLDWAKDWRLAGKFKVADLSVREPVSLVSKSTQVSGRLFGDGSFSATAKEPAKLADVLNANFHFRVEDGVLYGLDLAKAATLLLKQGQKGGETKFDELSGVLNMAGKHYKLRDLKVTSGLIAANGKVDMNPQKQLDGLVEVEVKSSATLAAIPLQISGTVDNPTVLPTKAALAGAVAGTAILGPLGTSMGVKAGSALGKLFGSDDKK